MKVHFQAWSTEIMLYYWAKFKTASQQVCGHFRSLQQQTTQRQELKNHQRSTAESWIKRLNHPRARCCVTIGIWTEDINHPRLFTGSWFVCCLSVLTHSCRNHKTQQSTLCSVFWAAWIQSSKARPSTYEAGSKQSWPEHLLVNTLGLVLCERRKNGAWPSHPSPISI